MRRMKNIRAEMPVLGSDGHRVGAVAMVDGGCIRLAGEVREWRVPMSCVARVDEAVHLTLRAAKATREAERRQRFALRREKRAMRTRRLRMYLPWIVGVIGVIVFLGVRPLLAG